jgi:hypothetical protein
LNGDHQFEEDAAEVKLALSFVLEQCSSISSILDGHVWQTTFRRTEMEQQIYYEGRIWSTKALAC